MLLFVLLPNYVGMQIGSELLQEPCMIFAPLFRIPLRNPIVPTEDLMAIVKMALLLMTLVVRFQRGCQFYFVTCTNMGSRLSTMVIPRIAPNVTITPCASICGQETTTIQKHAEHVSTHAFVMRVTLVSGQQRLPVKAAP